MSALWQILAILALAGIVVVVILAIIEPGPLEKRRPFARRKRSPESEVGGRNPLNPRSAPDSADRNLGRNDVE